MPQYLATKVKTRHDRLLFLECEGDTKLGASYGTRVPSRPARIVFQPERDVKPRTRALMQKLCAFDGTGKPLYYPRLFRGSIGDIAEVQEFVPVRLSEEPSGRSMEADLPIEWFPFSPLFEGLPFRLFTWIRLDDPNTGHVSGGHRVESLLGPAENAT